MSKLEVPHSPTHVSRRTLLASGATFGAGMLAAALAPDPAQGSTPTPASAASSGAPDDATVFFSDQDMNFQVLFTLGAAGYSAAEFGEVATAINLTNRAGASYDALYRVFRAMGLRVAGYGRASLPRRDSPAARGAFLRASSYLALPLYFALGTSFPGRLQRQRGAYRAMNDEWARAASLSDPPIERVRLPYGATTMPGWFMRPPGPRKRRPTVILNNGNDAQNIGLYVYGGAEAVARGYNALIFEGPGQGSMIFERGIPFRPDWEKVITPVVSYLARRPDVDAQRIALVGWSQGGGLVARAAAFEHRLAALVLDPGVVDYPTVFHLPPDLVRLALSHRDAEANAEWAHIYSELPASLRFAYRKGSYPFRQPTFAKLVRTIYRFNTAEFLPRVKAPTLVLQYQGDSAFPGQGREADRLLRTRKAFHQFGPADGTQLHDAPMAPQRRNQVVFDWLSGVL